ncbi:hypothetical protein CONCODRAFT_18843 [Conidiobolus coronatus NRRL 28638]|uniref:Extracellular membrane protein CFEM domain-containing protein n=1 Tax=Conidiobolus coronatus (strain ATCC 28846 / CBS 209.66 / NRRL 28638) TaxID=796925 RepID=A0A137P0Z2_CONC2|nr:hypothetical protein CONCODRAFT_18843 [Conidiobolus coronatus NRRL 28638]|eukprot:KXN68707.1 hypothetical protein CONCODRAFT_18843 [Conidiobolus coronatus NRRL 28638]
MIIIALVIFLIAFVNCEKPHCYNVLECKCLSLTQNTDYKDKLNVCKSLESEIKIFNCSLASIGLRSDQIPKFWSFNYKLRSCESSLDQVESCIDKCALDDYNCYETCNTQYNLSSLDCIADNINLTNFDSKEAYRCSKYCDTLGSLDKIYDCDIKCKEQIYNKLSELDKSDKLQINGNSTSDDTTSLSPSSALKDNSSANSTSLTSTSIKNQQSSISSSLSQNFIIKFNLSSFIVLLLVILII